MHYYDTVGNREEAKLPTLDASPIYTRVMPKSRTKKKGKSDKV